MNAQAGLQCGFGDLLGGETLAAVRDQGFTIVRIDLQAADQAKTAQLAQEVIDAGLQPLCIVRRVEQLSVLPPGALVEAGNEPDIAKFGWSKRTYRDFADACVAEALARGQRLYVGVVSNLNRRGFDFLESMPWHHYPPEICCSVHRYPDGRSPTNPHAGCKSREHEVAKLRAIVGSRPLAVTEVGYHDGPGGWPELEVAAHMAWERRFFSEQGFEICVGFQLNDGRADDASTEAHFGFRRSPSLAWKPVSARFAGVV
ncbi:hypothetical protein UFOVP998_6 [uncultured Caudovirales phage]|uniref:Uncharacterized protein n=1 Tax=uncultured Caudovirales phage TaxID=2100421 RepID=A0A6J5RZX1_9CAUD|nr:hypothetical protein UFOVP998_6 [uncultured Caudovirales phage]CAB4199501.1 hypothetical protein UFOVP1331_53 [uncultured Caudovirales phage]CAB4212736.1 hypothetical protein UFOVP1442_22 [uncultured Caudovirales phage]CAB5228038.1 hypothetical protein UFOVP1535_29 [uncultured Caudovirales phage]